MTPSSIDNLDPCRGNSREVRHRSKASQNEASSTAWSGKPCRQSRHGSGLCCGDPTGIKPHDAETKKVGFDVKGGGARQKSGACKSHGHLHLGRVWRVASKREGSGNTYKMANLRGLSDKTGNKAKQMTKQANAATLKAPKTRRRSHRLTVSSTREQIISVHSGPCLSLVSPSFRRYARRWGA
jgi:hypothetical protein